MSFSPDQIRGMLASYEADHKTGMNTAVIAQEIYDYTCGYVLSFSFNRNKQIGVKELHFSRHTIIEAVV